MNNKLTIGLMVATLTMFAVVASNVEAYRGDATVKGPNYSEERHEAMTTAFANRDFAAWKELMQGKGRVTQVINEGNFESFARAHELSLQGKTDEANELRQQLGLGLHNGSGQGQGQGYGRGRVSN